MSEIDIIEKMHKANEEYVPARNYSVYLKIDGEVYKIDNQMLQKAKHLLRYRPHSITRSFVGEFSSGFDFYRTYLRGEA